MKHCRRAQNGNRVGIADCTGSSVNGNGCEKVIG